MSNDTDDTEDTDHGGSMSGDHDSAAPRSAFEHQITERVNSLESSRKFWKWAFGLGAPILSSAGIAIIFWLGSQVQASAERAGETKATIDAVRKSIDVLDLDVRELRARILKLSGIDNAPHVTLARAP